MKLHTVFITYNRLELTNQAIESYLETVTVSAHYLIVDNGSTDGTEDWAAENMHPLFPLHDNRYPGFACNLGWEFADEATSHLHRADNDFIFLPGWCEEVERVFQDANVGQVGLRTGPEEDHNGHNVGGNCIIRRELWDAGLRWKETPWPEIKTPGYTEDSYFSPAVERMGYRWTRVERPCIRSISMENPDDPYYIKSWADRGIVR